MRGVLLALAASAWAADPMLTVVEAQMTRRITYGQGDGRRPFIDDAGQLRLRLAVDAGGATVLGWRGLSVRAVTSGDDVLPASFDPTGTTDPPRRPGAGLLPWTWLPFPAQRARSVVRLAVAGTLIVAEGDPVAATVDAEALTAGIALDGEGGPDLSLGDSRPGALAMRCSPAADLRLLDATATTARGPARPVRLTRRAPIAGQVTWDANLREGDAMQVTWAARTREVPLAATEVAVDLGVELPGRTELDRRWPTGAEGF